MTSIDCSDNKKVPFRSRSERDERIRGTTQFLQYTALNAQSCAFRITVEAGTAYFSSACILEMIEVLVGTSAHTTRRLSEVLRKYSVVLFFEFLYFTVIYNFFQYK